MGEFDKAAFCIEKPDTEPVQSWCWAGVGWYVQFYGLLSHFLLLRCLTPVNFLKGVGTMNVLISLVCSYFLSLFVSFIVWFSEKLRAPLVSPDFRSCTCVLQTPMLHFGPCVVLLLLGADDGRACQDGQKCTSSKVPNGSRLQVQNGIILHSAVLPCFCPHRPEPVWWIGWPDMASFFQCCDWCSLIIVLGGVMLDFFEQGSAIRCSTENGADCIWDLALFVMWIITLIWNPGLQLNGSSL